MRPILSYGCPVWGYAAKTNINILDTLQNSTIRMIVKASRNPHDPGNYTNDWLDQSAASYMLAGYSPQSFLIYFSDMGWRLASRAICPENVTVVTVSKIVHERFKAFLCNNRIVGARRKHLDDFLRGRIIGRLEYGRTQLEASEEHGIAQSERSLRGFGNDSKMMVINRRNTTSDLSRQLSSDTGTTVSRQTVYRRLGHIGLYGRKSVRYVPLTATHCRLRLTWSREHALWTPQQWPCVMFSDESRFSLQSDSRRTLIWRVPGTRYHQENTIERHRYGGAGWLVWGGIILGSRTDLHVQSVAMTGHIYRDVILEQHVPLFRGAMGAEFLFMDDNARPHRANIVDECLQSEDITRMDWPAYSPDLNPIEHVWDMLGRRIAARNPLPPVYRNFGEHCLMSGVIFPKIRLII
ncbi:transposable element Tcb1 transposase [Trichonephila clavipes]|nr:transposable element Tcb1 transposase [Trichonephila clavipes]